MPDHKDALIRLFRDNDPETIDLIKQQLSEGNPDTMLLLRDLSNFDDKEVSRHAREILSSIESRKAVGDFSLLSQMFPGDGDLETATWLLAKAFLPTADIDHYRHQVDVWGRRLSGILGGATSAYERVALTSDFMAHELGFEGNSADYYNLNNSLLPTVIDSRHGIPITLSALYMFVGARAGITIEGINLPGHFIVKHEEIYFDPFHQGKQLTLKNCEEILLRQQLNLSNTHLERANSRMILLRMLANILYVLVDRDEPLMHARVAGWIKNLERS